MRYVAVFCFIFVLECASEMVLQLDNAKTPKVFESAIKCTSEQGFDLSILERFRSSETKKDEKFLKLFYCALDDLKIVKKDGHFIENEAVKFVPKKQREDLKKALEECNKETGIDRLDVLYNVSKCLKEKKGLRLAI
uniref:Odorant Binding Protein n=1 Tax=Epiphyas postvittana TaxID=65032 RepID=A0A0K8TUV6_EPIPO